MYSWEIYEVIKNNNYNISLEDYIKILSTSPQIREIKYNVFEDKFHIVTDDRYNFNFKVKKRERR